MFRINNLKDLDYSKHKFEEYKYRDIPIGEIEAVCDECGYGVWILLNVEMMNTYIDGKLLGEFHNFNEVKLLTCKEVVIKKILE